jgi:hypothetical protein
MDNCFAPPPPPLLSPPAYTHLEWQAEMISQDLEDFNAYCFECILQEFGFIVKTYSIDIAKKKSSFRSVQDIELIGRGGRGDGWFRFTTLPHNKWCSMSLSIPYGTDFDIVKFKQAIQAEFHATEIKDTLELIYRTSNLI